MGLVINTLVEEGIGISEGLDAQAAMNPVLSDVVDLYPEFLFLSNEVLAITLALDTEQMAPSVHSMPAFNSFAQIGDDVYAAGDAGIYRLGGNTDDGAAIHTGVAWGKISFRKINRKKIRAIFLEGEITGTRSQAVTESGSGTYTISRNRISVGRNLVGRDWALRLADFERLEAVELALMLGRR